MKVIIHPSQIKGNIHAPASKSSMQRALAAALLSKGTTVISNPGHSNDDKAIMNVIKELGATIEIINDQLIIKSKGVKPVTEEVNCGESGLGIRMFAPIIALSDKEITINGEGSLLTRPMNFFDIFFPKLDVDIQSNQGKLPLKIKGPLQPKNIEVDGSLSSQFITGLLMAYGASPNPSAGGALGSERKSASIKVRYLKSKPYIDLTLEVMKQFGLRVPENINYKEFIFSESPNSQLTLPDRQAGNHPINYFVESDWSGGAFLLVAGAIAGPITVRGLDLTSAQADKKITDVLMSANAAIAIEAKGIKIHPSEMTAFDFDSTDCPDLFPPLVALAAYCKGDTNIKGVSRLTHKESNRAITLQEEFGKMGVKIELKDDIMIIHGGNALKGAKLHSHHDHRVAMACAVAALKADGETIIEEAEAVKKSYPDFFKDLSMLGARIYNHFSIHDAE